MTLACLNLVCVWAIRRQMPSVPRDIPEEEVLPMARDLTRMMNDLEERLKVELRAYVRELLLQARIEELIRQRDP